MHLLAFLGIVLKHSGHFFSVGSNGVLFLAARSCNLLRGFTTRKNITAAIVINEISKFIKSPYKNLLLFMVKLRLEKSGFPPIAPISGVMRSFTNPVTTA